MYTYKDTTTNKTKTIYDKLLLSDELKAKLESGEIIEVSNEDPTLEEAKEACSNKLKEIISNSSSFNIEFNGSTFYIDDDAKFKLLSVVNILNTTNTIYTEWIDVNNNKILFTKKEFINFSNLVASKTSNIIFNHNRILKEVETADTKEKLYDISLDLETNLGIDSDVDVYKNIAVNAMNNKRNEVISQGFEYNGKIYQCSSDDQIKVSAEVLNLQINTSKTEINWIASDNSITTFTKDEFILFAISLASYIESLIFKARSLKDKIISATTKEEIDLITWDTSTKQGGTI